MEENGDMGKGPSINYVYYDRPSEIIFYAVLHETIARIHQIYREYIILYRIAIVLISIMNKNP